MCLRRSSAFKIIHISPGQMSVVCLFSLLLLPLMRHQMEKNNSWFMYVCFGSNTWMSVGISYCLISACVVEQVTNKNNFAESNDNDDDDGDRIEVGFGEHDANAHTWDRCFYAIASTYNETTSMLTHTYTHQPSIQYWMHTHACICICKTSYTQSVALHKIV